MSNRIDRKFAELMEKNRKALITYITAGDPDLSVTPRLVKAMEDGGADIIELGIPYSDPIAEGPVIQAASARALKNKIRIDDIFACVKQIRKSTGIPLVFLLYYNCIFKYGKKKFFEECSKAGVDGLIIPDLPCEERDDINDILGVSDIEVITLIAPTSNNRIERVVKGARGFIYCVSSLGVTGIRAEFHKDLSNFISKIREYTGLPRAIGFGISTSEQVRELKNIAEGLIVGSAIVKKIGEAGSNEEAVESIRKYVAELREAMDN